MLFAKLLIGASSLAIASGGAVHGGAAQECSCAQHEPDHPFTIDCSNGPAIRAAAQTLDTQCSAAVQFEWGAIFSTPASAYKWVSQAKGTPAAWAESTMKIVVFATDAADAEHLQEKADAATDLMAAGSCPVKNTGDSIVAPVDAGACYTLTFPASTSTDFVATIDFTGVANAAIFTEHAPSEFERDTHYLVTTDMATDNNPVKTTDAQEFQCRHVVDPVSGVNVCAQAFFILQAHHDYCSHETLTLYEERVLFHSWESKCVGCSIKRKYDPALNDCPVIDCTDTTIAQLGYSHLQENCVAATTAYSHEWAASFDTPGTDYLWVSQAAAVGNTWAPTAAANYSYEAPTMRIVACAVASNAKSDLYNLQEAADTLLSGPSSGCPTITASCTPGDATCVGQTITPTTGCVCANAQFPTQDATTGLKDFHATIATGTNNHVAFFTEHKPGEFERDTHYLLSMDMATDNNPVTTLGPAAAHVHRRRRLADPGSCCNNATQQGAWKQIVAYHDLCEEDQLPTYIETGFHAYEESCEDYFCNLVGPEVNQTICPYPPPAPPAPPPLEAPPADTGAIIGIAAGCGAVILILVIFVYILYSKEKKGTPLFTQLDPAKKAPASKASASAA